MTLNNGLLTTSALALCCAAGMAQAEVTPQQVWDDLTAYAESFGYSVQGTQDMDGDTLRITDAAFVMSVPDDDGSFSFTMSDVSLVPAADGAVAITFPASMPISAEFEGDFGDQITLVIDYTQSGLDMLATGAPGNISYAYTADTLGFALTELTVGGETMGRDLAMLEVNAGPVAGSSTTQVEDNRRNVQQQTTLGSVQYSMAFADPEGGGQGSLSGEMSGLAFSGTSEMPADFDPQMFESIGRANLSGTGTISHNGNQATFSASEDDTTTNGVTSTQGASIEVALADDTLRYDVTATGLATSLQGGDLPLPIQFAVQELGFLVDMPMAASESPQDMQVALTFGGFTMSDLIWGIFDPGAALPRDPATIMVDLAGKVTPFVSLYDAEALAQLEERGGVPGELNALTLKTLTVEAAGVRLEGDGDVTFDTEGGPALGGMPRPVGEVNMRLQGANALIDKLIQMGLVQDSDAMGARMMMGMFTVPQSGPDDLSSRIEFTQEGQILANGQRIQ